jgi:CPA1 family monovalent cation:H+ antiporter
VPVVEAVLALVVLAIAIAAAAERLRAPAPSLLVLAGLGVGFLPGLPSPNISPLLITLGVLPPLLFAAAHQVSLPDLRRVWRPVAVLAVGLVLVTATAVAFVTHAIDPAVAIAPAFVLGAILASTDPVAVAALSRRLSLPDRVVTLVQAESLFNDATSLVLFQVAVLAVTTGGLAAANAVLRFFALAGGGLLIGLAAGAAAALLLRRAHEPTVQTAVMLVTPYAAAVAAEAAHVSTVTAVIVTGMVVARRRRGPVRAAGRLMATSVYDAVVFLLEAVVFAIIGLELASFIRHLPESDRTPSWELIAAISVTLLLVRGMGLLAVATVPPLLPRARRTRSARAQWPTAAVVTWAGARGVVPLAAALSVPLTVEGGALFPHRQLLLVAAIGAVVISLVVQGTTLEPLVHRVGLTVEQQPRHEQVRRARAATTSAARGLLPQGARPAMRDDAAATAGEGAAATAGGGDYQQLRLRLLEVEAEELARLLATGEISADVYREVLRDLDLEHRQQARKGAPPRKRPRRSRSSGGATDGESH